MRRLHRSVVISGFVAALASPVAAYAQTGDRPATQLFMAPTGRALPKGQGYFKAIGLALPSWQGGFTDRFSLGIGMPIFGLGQAAVLTPKFQIQRSEKHSTSIGAVDVLTTEGSFNIAYVAHTIERENGAIHVTAIAPIARQASLRAVVLMMGAEYRVNDRVTFITENYVAAAGSIPIVSGGVRIRAPHTTWDLGLFVPPGFEYGARPMPMISAGWKF